MIDQCVILTGGLGSRLGALTHAMPKPLLPIAGRPFLDILVAEASRRGLRNFLFLAGHCAEEIVAFVDALKSSYPKDYNFVVSIEPLPLGTGGALINARDLLDERFLLLNGDTWFDFNWLDLIVRSKQTSRSMVAARTVAVADRYESFALAEDGLVVAIQPRGTMGAKPAIINAGVYCMQKRDIVGFAGKVSLEDIILPELVACNSLGAHEYSGFFIDIGIPATYDAGQRDIPARMKRGALFLDRDGVINHDDNYVHRPDQIRWIAGAKQAIKEANDAGLYVFVVTNQAGVARGLYCEDDVIDLHKWMGRALRSAGANIDDWRYCPYHPCAIASQYRALHPWRKPQPGMILDLMDHWPIEKSKSLMIGDQDTDIDAARSAGVAASQFKGGDLAAFVASAWQQKIYDARHD